MSHQLHKARAITPKGPGWEFSAQLNTFMSFQTVQSLLLTRAVTLYWKNRQTRPVRSVA